MSALDALSGIEFEQLITRLLEHMGFRAEMTKASGDGGVDIVATLDQPLTGVRFLIQCKRYAPDSLVGAATVRDFYGALTADRSAVKGVLVTTSGFTAQAQEFARGLPIELIGSDHLQQLLDKYGLDVGAEHPDKAQQSSSTVQCPGCGVELAQSAARCSGCGRCLQCGAPVQETARFCWSCRAHLRF